MAREQYEDQVRLLVRLLPLLAEEPDFALKGGTAINLFHRDLPRLSVDIDLTYLPVKPRDESLDEIRVAMDRLVDGAVRIQGVQARAIAGGGGGATRILARAGAATVKIETSPVMRGVVFDPKVMRVSPSVEEAFGFVEARIVSFEDLFGGKLHAALDRQHPRDLYDVRLLYENEGLTDPLFAAFLVYLACSGRPPHELLDPSLPDIEPIYQNEFVGMTHEPVAMETLLETRERLIDDIRQRLTGKTAAYLRSLHEGNADFGLIGLPDAADLPAVRWKLHNIERLKANDPDKHREHGDRLAALLQ